MKHMKKKRNINIVIYIIVFSIGCCFGKLVDWGYFVLTKEISIIDALSIFLTIGCAIYIARVLEKEVQDNRIEKDLFISQVEKIETPIVEIENNLSSCTYTFIVNLYSRSNIARHKFFKRIETLKSGSFIDKDIKDSLTKSFKQLKPLLTDTAPTYQDIPDIKIKSGRITYSPNRLVEIQEVLQNIQDDLFKLKIMINMT